MYHVLNGLNVKIVMMEHLQCGFVVLIQKWLLLNIYLCYVYIGYFSVMTCS